MLGIEHLYARVVWGVGDAVEAEAEEHRAGPGHGRRDADGVGRLGGDRRDQGRGGRKLPEPGGGGWGGGVVSKCYPLFRYKGVYRNVTT